MRSRAAILACVAALLAILAAFALTAGPASASLVTRQQISNDSSQDARPRIAAGRVAWESGATGDTEIDLFDGDSTTSVTVNAEDIEPEISGTYLVWKRRLAGGPCRLDVFDFDTTGTLNSSMPCDREALVAGPHVIWTDAGGLLGNDVFVSTGGADPEQLGRSSADENFARVGDVAGDPRAVWIENGQDIVYWNGNGTDVIADAPPSELRSQLRMSGGRAVWTDVVGGDREVFLFTGTTVLQLTNNDYDDEEPALRGSHVVWTGYPDAADEGEIFHYDGTTTERVTDDDLHDFGPRVSLGADGVTIAWVKDEGANEVWMFDGCESTRVSVDDTTDDGDVELDGNQVAWVRGSGTASEIWTATVTCDVACGNGELEPGEECDDGDTVSGNGCSADCLEEICGNGRVDSGEQCDDGNTDPLDGCDAACLLECGNGVLEPAAGEQCDDGNRVGGDLCDENCIDEICGNGVLQAAAGEACDDGNTASGDGCSADCGTVESPAPVAQQRCIQKLNERGAALAKAQHKLSLTCLGDAAKGDLAALGPSMTAQGCLEDDPKGKVAKAQAKTLEGETSQCKPGNLPTFAYTSGAAVNAAGEAESLALMADLFGANLDLAVIPKAVDPPGARCQKSVAQATQALSNRLFKLAFKEKKLLLAGKEDGSLARSNEALQTQLLAFLEADAGGKLAQKEADLRAAARTKCGSVGLDAAFPGCAPSADPTALAACATSDARCRFCRAFDAFDGLAIDCDDFDDAAANASCP